MKFDRMVVCGMYFVDPLKLRPVLNPAWRMTATLKWSAEDAAAIVVDIRRDSEVPNSRNDYASWRFSRDHIFDAAIRNQSAGVGDYRIAPFFDPYTVTNWLYFNLRDDVEQEERTLAADQRTVAKFVAGTVEAVPLGAEDYSKAVDRFLATLPRR